MAETEACTEQSECDGGTIPVWGDGMAVRSYTYVDDLVEGVYMLMQSDLEGPVNIGSPEYVTVDELVATVIEVSGKRIQFKHVEGPAGVQARNPSTGPWSSGPRTEGSGHRFSKARIHSLGWRARFSLKDGISRTYPWIEPQVKAAWEAERRATEER